MVVPQLQPQVAQLPIPMHGVTLPSPLVLRGYQPVHIQLLLPMPTGVRIPLRYHLQNLLSSMQVLPSTAMLAVMEYPTPELQHPCQEVQQHIITRGAMPPLRLALPELEQTRIL